MTRLFKLRRSTNDPLELTETSKVALSIGVMISILVSVWGSAWIVSKKVTIHDNDTKQTNDELRRLEKSILDLSNIVGYHHNTDWTLREQIAWVKETRILNRECKVLLADPIEVSRETHVPGER